MSFFGKTICFLIIMCTSIASMSPVVAQETVPPTLDDLLNEFRSIEQKLVTEKKQIRLDFIVEAGQNPTPSKFSEAPGAFEWNLLRNGDLWKLSHPTFLSRTIDGASVMVKGWSTHAIKGTFLFLRSHEREIVIVYSSEKINSGVVNGIEYHTFLGYNLAKEIMKAIKVDYAVDYAKVLEDQVSSYQLKDVPFLPDCLEEHRDSYRVLPEPETIDGHLCWVVERPGMDKLWVAPDLGYMLCKRQFHWRPGKPLRRETRAKEFKEIEPGLFFPMAVEVDKYAGYEWEDEAIWNKITGQSVYRVKDISFSNITDADLAIALPIGTRVVDEARGVEYIVQEDGADPFAGPLEWKLKRARFTLFRIVMMISGVLLILFALFRTWHDHKQKRTPTLPLILFCLMPLSLQANELPVRMDAGAFDWKPVWREAGDCGPGALYVLMKLEQQSVSLDTIKRHLPVNSAYGCSMASLYDASKQMNFPVDIRFVPPSRIMEVPRPFILHGISGIKENIGHFIVVLDIDPKTRTLTLIDPSQERFSRNPLDSALQGYSGYVLVPRHSLSRRWNLLPEVPLLVCGLGCFAIVYCRKPFFTVQWTPVEPKSELSAPQVGPNNVLL